jgi:hypothetical protein
MVDPVQKFVNSTSETVVDMSIAAAVGSLCARVFTRMSPIHGAVFSAVAALVFKVVTPLFAKVFAGEGSNDSSKIVGIVLSIATGVLASAALTTGIGYPISFAAGLVLTCSVVAVSALLQVGLAYAGVRLGDPIFLP